MSLSGKEAGFSSHMCLTQNIKAFSSWWWLSQSGLKCPHFHPMPLLQEIQLNSIYWQWKNSWALWFLRVDLHIPRSGSRSLWENRLYLQSLLPPACFFIHCDLASILLLPWACFFFGLDCRDLLNGLVTKSVFLPASFNFTWLILTVKIVDYSAMCGGLCL